MKLTSTAFGENQSIPKLYTCEGKDMSPPLAWSGVPANAKSLALIVDDPDAPDPAAPRMTWVHWVLYNIPRTPRPGPEGVASSALPKVPLEGLNDWQRTGYGGPCPPIGRHRYFHKLYALDASASGSEEAEQERAGTAMKGHIIAETQLVDRQLRERDKGKR